MKVSSYLHHKSSGRAFCWMTGSDHRRRAIYLGVYGSPESRVKYEELKSGGVLTIRRLWERFAGEFLPTYYKLPGGSPSREIVDYGYSVRELLAAFGDLPASSITLDTMKTTRKAMIDAGLNRSVVNQRMGRVYRFIEWSIEEGLIPDRRVRLKPLPRNRSDAPESRPVRPAISADVEVTLTHLNAVVAAMVRFQLLTGCRPGEACSLRRSEIEMRPDVWIVKKLTHKMQYKGGDRMIVAGPRAIAILQPWFDRATADAADVIFRPILSAGHRTRPGEQYLTSSYSHAIIRACERAGVPRWHPNQLRHLAATRVRSAFGLDAAQGVLGHNRASTTEIYAEINFQKVVETMKKIG